MSYINRKITHYIEHHLARGKSILLFGPRQTGKTTLINQQLSFDISYSFVHKETRLRFEKEPVLLERELMQFTETKKTKPLVFIDEIQKIPTTMDIIQDLIDKKLAQFILTGSSARKLKHGANINLLPGRVIKLMMDPLHLDEYPKVPTLEELLLYGGLPGIINESDYDNREIDLYSYVTTYLEDEIRAEALVRQVGDFARFLEIAASESGNIINNAKLSQVVGVANTTISEYFQILEDCLVIHRIDPLTNSPSRRRLIKSPKFLFFDLGIRRAAANEGVKLPLKYLGQLFEQWVGIELLQQTRFLSPRAKIKYWRDTAGAEIDYILEISPALVPIEVKWSDKPNKSDAKHLVKFLTEYENANQAYIVCRTPRPYKIEEGITAVPWQELPALVKQILDQ